jgi:ATP-binding cassette, subfamily B, multidrug efflux pump
VFSRLVQRAFGEHNQANVNVAAVVVTAAFFAPTIDVFSTLAIAVVIGFGGYLLLAGDVSGGVVAAFLIYVQQFFWPIQPASDLHAAASRIGWAERISAILDEPEEVPHPP